MLILILLHTEFVNSRLVFIIFGNIRVYESLRYRALTYPGTPGKPKELTYANPLPAMA